MPSPERPVFHPTLAGYFVSLRKDNGWTQSEAADEAASRAQHSRTAPAHRELYAGLTRQVLLRLESGKTKHPSPETLRAIALLYEVPYSSVVAEVTATVYGRDLASHGGTQDSPSGADKAHGGPQHGTGTDTARLVALAREAGRLEGEQAALERLAKTIAGEIERLDRESESADSATSTAHKVRRVRRR